MGRQRLEMREVKVRCIGLERKRFRFRVGESAFKDKKRLFTFPFLVSPSQLQKRKSAPRNDGRLEERLGTT